MLFHILGHTMSQTSIRVQNHALRLIDEFRSQRRVVKLHECRYWGVILGKVHKSRRETQSTESKCCTPRDKWNIIAAI